MSRQRKIELEGEAVELQLKNKKDEIYMRVLAVFGIITILIATTITIMAEMRMTTQGITLYVMGLFLFAAGMIWREKNKNKLSKTNENIERFQDEEDDSYRFDRTN